MEVGNRVRDPRYLVLWDPADRAAGRWQEPRPGILGSVPLTIVHVHPFSGRRRAALSRGATAWILNCSSCDCDLTLFRARKRGLQPCPTLFLQSEPSARRRLSYHRSSADRRASRCRPEGTCEVASLGDLSADGIMRRTPKFGHGVHNPSFLQSSFGDSRLIPVLLGQMAAIVAPVFGYPAFPRLMEVQGVKMRFRLVAGFVGFALLGAVSAEAQDVRDTFEYWDTSGNGDLTCPEALRGGARMG